MYDVVVGHHTDRTGEGVRSPVCVIPQCCHYCRLVLTVDMITSLLVCWSVEEMLNKLPPAGKLSNSEGLHLWYGRSVVVPEQDCLHSHKYKGKCSRFQEKDISF